VVDAGFVRRRDAVLMAEPEFAIHAGWFVGVTSECTCGMEMYGHLPECGMEPIATVDEVLEALREKAERTIGEEVVTRAPEVLYLPGGAAAVDDPEHRAAIAAAHERAGGAGVLIIPIAQSEPLPEGDPF
jgi:hypothetical protein